jgi:hypothetical protein
VQNGIGSHLNGRRKEIEEAMEPNNLLNLFGGKKSRET